MPPAGRCRARSRARGTPARGHVSSALALIAYMYRDAVRTSLRPLRLAIEAAVPHGRTDHGGKNDRGAFGESRWTRNG